MKINNRMNSFTQHIFKEVFSLKYFFICSILMWSTLSFAQSFTLKSGTPFPNLIKTSIAFADVDGDGDQDVLITGESPALTTKLYTNDGTGTYTEVTPNPFTGVTQGALAFADIDGDNDQDVLITGISSSGASSKLYTNDGSGIFTEVVGTPFANVSQSSVAFADVDGDNDQDVLITGSNIAKLYTNNGSGTFTEVAGTPFTGVNFSSIAFADVDGDNDQDVLITGSHTSKLYTNNGSGTFTLVAGTPFADVSEGSIAFADVDGDNDQDVIITGADASAIYHSKLYTNNGSGIFTEVAGTPFLAVRSSAVAFADVDGDNDQDVLINGDIGSLQYRTRLYMNDGAGTFTTSSISLTDIAQGSAAFADIDGDNDQDLMMMGRKISGAVGIASELYQNNNSPVKVTLGLSNTCASNTSFNVPIEINQDATLGGVNFVLDYDETVLTYTGNASTSYATMTTANDGLVNHDAVNGKISYIWTATNAAGLAYAANTTLLELQFSINGTGAASPVFTWSTTPGDCDLADDAANPISSTFIDATGTILPAPTATLTSDATNNTICAGDNITFTATGVGVSGSGNGLHFTQTNDQVSGTNSALPLNNDARTIEAWIKADGNSAGDESILEWGSTFIGNARSGLFIRSSGVLVHIAGNNDLDGSTNIRDGQWHHVAVTHDGTTTTLYLDGNVEATAAKTYATDNTNFTMGSNANGEQFDGTIDEVRIWNVAKSQADLNNNKSTELLGSETGLVAYYNFNQGTAGGINTGITTLTDGSSSNADGTLTNFALTGNTSNWVAGASLTPSGLGTYQFFVNNVSQGAASSTNTFSTTTLANNDVVKVTVTDINGCTNDATITVTVNPLPTPTLTSSDADNKICTGGSVTFTAGGADEYIFKVGNTVVQAQSATNTYTTTSLANGDVVSVIGVNTTTTCQAPSATTHTMTVIDCYSYSGKLVYKNAAETYMGNVTATITEQSSGATVQAVTSLADGTFSFANLFDGENYSIAFNTATKTSGGYNAADARHIQLHVIGSPNPNFNPLTGINEDAGDVNADVATDAADGLLIKRRFLGLDNSFASGDWIFETVAFTVSGSDITNQTVYALSYGDVNGTFTPNSTENPTVFFVNGSNIQITDGQQLSIPLNVTDEVKVGAISLVMNYPSSALSIDNITLANGQNVLFNTINDELRIAWSALSTLDLTSGDVLLNLHVTVNDAQSFINQPLTLQASSDVANEMANSFNNFEIELPVFNTFSTNTNSITEQILKVNNYPNPFNGTTMITYTLPTTSEVSITVTDALGRDIAQLINEKQQAGGQQVQFNAANLSDGVYFYTIMVNDGNNQYQITKPMILVR